MFELFTNCWSVHTVLQILTFATGSSSSRWCLAVVWVLICVHSSTDSVIRHCVLLVLVLICDRMGAGLSQQLYWFAHLSFLCVFMTSQADFISQANITSQAHTRARLTRPCFFMCFPMTSQADFTSQANITSQAHTRARLTRPWFLICFPMTSQVTSQGNITSQTYTRARLTHPCCLLLLHDFTSWLHITSEHHFTSFHPS